MIYRITDKIRLLLTRLRGALSVGRSEESINQRINSTRLTSTRLKAMKKPEAVANRGNAISSRITYTRMQAMKGKNPLPLERDVMQPFMLEEHLEAMSEEGEGSQRTRISGAFAKPQR